MKKPTKTSARDPHRTAAHQAKNHVDLPFLVDDLKRADVLNAAMVSLAQRIDWSKTNPSHILEALRETPSAKDAVTAWAQEEHESLCSCCRHDREVARWEEEDERKKAA